MARRSIVCTTSGIHLISSRTLRFIVHTKKSYSGLRVSYDGDIKDDGVHQWQRQIFPNRGGLHGKAQESAAET